jgi:hypothetical protein
MYNVRFGARLLFGSALVSFAASGCSWDAGEAHEEPIGAHSEAISSTNRLSMNRLKASSLHFKKLATGALSANGVKLIPTSLVESKDGRDALEYLLRCALPEGLVLKATWSGKVYQFHGLIGLAPTWINQPLSQNGRRWVTACLLAHVNGYGKEVFISLRGGAASLTTTPDETAQFTKEELSFYGDIFKEIGQPEMYACAGKDVLANCPDLLGKYKAGRACKPSEPCSIKVPGPCYDDTPLAQDACGSEDGGLYSDCHACTEPLVTGWPAGSTSYSEVVTVFLRPTEFEEFYGDCGGLINIEIDLGLGL